MKLVVITDSNTCRFYHYEKHSSQLSLLKEISHPENKLKNGDMTSDKQGHYKAGSTRGSYSPHSEPKEVAADNFSREIAKELNQERMHQDYNELIVIALPHMLGLLFQHLNKNVKELVTSKIEKDLLHMPQHELLNFLQAHTMPGANLK